MGIENYELGWGCPLRARGALAPVGLVGELFVEAVAGVSEGGVG